MTMYLGVFTLFDLAPVVKMLWTPLDDSKLDAALTERKMQRF